MEHLIIVLRELTVSQKVIESIDDISEQEKKDYYDSFSKIYTNNFRHSYSQLSSFLEDYSPDVYSTLRLWILSITQYAEDINPEKPVCKGLKKLLDHIELESIRLERMREVKMYAEQGSRTNTQTQEIADSAKTLSEEAMSAAKEAKANLSTYHEKSIGILSIFSAVILAFMGGISFSSGILNNLSEATMFRLIITILLLGFVLCNSIFILLRFTAYIIDGKCAQRFKDGVKAFNIVLLLVALVTLIVYAIGGGECIENWAGNPPEDASSVQQM